MRYYLFSIKGNEIESVLEKPAGKPVDYEHYSTPEEEEIYYKIIKGQVTNVICHARGLPAAKKATALFLRSL